MDSQKAYEGNKLIARFMGWELSEKGRKMKPETRYPHGYIKVHPHYLWFNFSWNWLMPVVRKIVEICTDTDDEIGIKLFESEYYASVMETVPMARIEDAFKVVVEFIEWYNTLKKESDDKV